MNEIVTKLLASTAAIALTAYSLSASAQSPQGATVAAGSIAVTRQGATTVITQGTAKGIIDWRSFSIGAQEAVRFDQPGRSSVTLNRVTSSEISRIDGNLSATGQVWIANPNGVMIGSGGQVNVGGLLATTGRVDAAEFLRSGRASIDQIGKDAAIVNQGTVNIQAGGYAALAAAAIRNDGVIAARSGSVALGSGKAMTVDFAGDKLITFQVIQPLDQAPAGADALISGSGTITAEGGTVLMSARAAKGVMDNVINLKGLTVANAVKVDGGTVSFGDGGVVQVSGRIDASDSAGPGGVVSVLGEKVGLMDGASIDASGSTGGGTVLVGGDWQGKGAVQNAQIAYVAPTASINADATANGKGGKVVVWADDTTRFNGTISARGGVAGGDGGQVETSGKRSLTVGPTSSVTTVNRAASSKAGDWLLDPNDITITSTQNNVTLVSNVYTATADAASSIDVTTLATDLSFNNIAIQTTSGFSFGSGDIIFGGYTMTYAGPTRTLTLQADRSIIFQTSSNIVSTNNPLHVVLEARRIGGANLGSVAIDGTITTHGGNITVGGPSGGAAIGGNGLLTGVSINGPGQLNAAGGNITIKGEGAANTPGVIIMGQVTTTTTGAITIDGTSGSGAASVAHGVAVGASGSVLNSGSGGITITGVSASGYSGSSGINVAGMVSNTGGGSITLTGQRGTGSTSANVAIAGGTVTTAGGDITLDGDYILNSTVGSNRVGVAIGSGASLSTTNGSIIINGTADQAVGGSNNFGVAIIGQATILASLSGNISIRGKRGDGANSQNIQVNGGGSVTNISTNTGYLTIDGSFASGFGNQSQMHGVLLQNAVIQTAGGAIEIKGKANSGSTSSDGVSFGSNVSVTNTGTTTGQIKISGDGNSASGSDIAFNTDALDGGTRPLIIEGNSLFVSATTFTTSGAGKTVFVPRTTSFDIAVDGVSSAGTLGLASAIGVTSGAVEIGSTFVTGLISSSASPVSIAKAFSFVSGVSSGTAVSFAGTVDDSGIGGLNSLKVQTSGGTVSFGGSIGSSSPLGSLQISGGPVEFGSSVVVVNTSTVGGGTGTQSYSGAVVLSRSGGTAFTSTGGAIVFGGPVDSKLTGAPIPMTVSATTGGVTFGNNFGVATSLSSFTTSVGTDAYLNFADYKTSGLQSYGGKVILGSNATLSSTGGNLISFSGTIDSAALAAKKSLTVNAGTASFLGAVGGTTPLSNFSVAVNNIALTLPTLTVDNLTLSTGSGAITQGGGATATVVSLTNISVNGGSVTLDNTGNDLNQISLTNSGAAATASFYDGASTMDVRGISGVSTLTLRGQSLVLQNGPISAGTLSLTGAAGTTFALANNANPVTVLVVPAAIGGLNFKSLGNLSVTGFSANSGALIESGGNLDITGAASASNNLILRAAAYMSYAGNLVGNAVSLYAGNTITDNGALLNSTGAPLNVTANGGSLSNVTVQGTSGTSAATPSLVILAQGSSITVNTVSMSNPFPVQSTPVTVASVPTQASVATVVSVASVPTLASVPPAISVASVLSTPSVASLATVPAQPNQAVIAIISNPETGGSILNQIQAPAVKFDLAPLIFAQTPPPPPNQPGVNPSAQSMAAIVTATPPGAFIPQGPPTVFGTGATLASAPTIKVDVADSGGGNGQVIAFGVSPEIGGTGGPGAGGGGGVGGSSLLPGLLRDNRGSGRRVDRVEPPLAQQPSQMNEEPFLD